LILSYTFKAKSSEGALIYGSMTADRCEAVVSALKQKGYYLLSVKQQSRLSTILHSEAGLGSRVSVRVWAIPMYEQMARDLGGNEDFLRIALIAVPPYGRGPISENCPCTLGRLPKTKEWFVTTPAVALLKNGKVTYAWEEKAPDFETIIQKMTKFSKKMEKSRFVVATNQRVHSL
jgi:hypothetical protein